MTSTNGTWVVREVDSATVEHLAAGHVPDPMATELGVDLVGDPNREDDEGYIWTRLSRSRDVRVVVPGSAVVLGSDVGRYLGKVVAWDFEVSDTDPIVTLELVPVSVEAVEAALERTRTTAA
ncbi:MAG: hypothetical protein ACYCTI_09715 [Acidimicrobiales bacterium]